MPRAYGVNAQLLGLTATSYGAAPVGDYARLPFVSSDLGAEQALVATDVIGQGRDSAPQTRDLIKVSGNVVVPADLRNIGQWLTWLLGAPTTTGAAAPYTHTWISGASSLPSFALEVGFTDVSKYFMELGLVLGSMAWDLKTSGNADVTCAIVGQSEVIAAASGGGAPTEEVFTRFSQFQGMIQKDGVTLAAVTAAKATYDNKLESVQVIRSDGLVDGVDPTLAELTGEIDVRFTDTTLMDAATAGTPMALTFGYQIDASNSFQVTAHHVLLPKTKLGVTGPGGIQAKYQWQASKDPTLGKMATFVLTNDVAAYS